MMSISHTIIYNQYSFIKTVNNPVNLILKSFIRISKFCLILKNENLSCIDNNLLHFI